VGTRSKDGSLQEGKEGVAFIAYRKKVPMVPIVTIGLENFKQNIKKLKRTKVTIKIGEPFEITAQGRLNAESRKQLIDEIMMKLVELLPPSLHGYYAGKNIEYQLTSTITK
jgi:1-acyl-sn-glycerol-3-phosphate acyltransferase